MKCAILNYLSMDYFICLKNIWLRTKTFINFRVQTIAYGSGLGSQILTSKVGPNFEAKKPEKFEKGSFYLFENLGKYSKIPLLPGKQEIKLKHGDFECKFSYELKNDNTQWGFISFLMFKII